MNELEIDADAPRERLEELKQLADDHCPVSGASRTPSTCAYSSRLRGGARSRL